ncbi:MAG: response regulator [Fibrobacteria bacterium]|nr:response regulator [Fibrobacteria bacterium]
MNSMLLCRIILNRLITIIINDLDCLKNIKANPETKEIPVIMVTSESEKTRIIEAVQAGAKNYVVKPFQPETLKEKIAAVLG